MIVLLPLGLGDMLPRSHLTFFNISIFFLSGIFSFCHFVVLYLTILIIQWVYHHSVTFHSVDDRAIIFHWQFHTMGVPIGSNTALWNSVSPPWRVYSRACVQLGFHPIGTAYCWITVSTFSHLSSSIFSLGWLCRSPYNLSFPLREVWICWSLRQLWFNSFILAHFRSSPKFFPFCSFEPFLHAFVRFTLCRRNFSSCRLLRLIDSETTFGQYQWEFFDFSLGVFVILLIVHTAVLLPNFIRCTAYCDFQAVTMSSVQKPFQISLEGNIAAGKSTLIEVFTQDPGVDVLPETLQLWRRLPIPGTGATHNLLESFYRDQSKYAFAFQSYVMLTKISQQVTASARPVKLLERGLHSVQNIFSQALHRQGLFPTVEYAVHTQWYDYFCEQHEEAMPDLFLWLKTSPSVNFQRVQLRAREEESGLSLEYLELLSELHEKWLGSSPFAERTIVIDGNKSKAEVLAACKAALKTALPGEIKAQMAMFKDE